jgi:hypothetical protein
VKLLERTRSSKTKGEQPRGFDRVCEALARARADLEAAVRRDEAAAALDGELHALAADKYLTDDAGVVEQRRSAIEREQLDARRDREEKERAVAELEGRAKSIADAICEHERGVCDTENARIESELAAAQDRVAGLQAALRFNADRRASYTWGDAHLALHAKYSASARSAIENRHREQKYDQVRRRIETDEERRARHAREADALLGVKRLDGGPAYMQFPGSRDLVIGPPDRGRPSDPDE